MNSYTSSSDNKENNGRSRAPYVRFFNTVVLLSALGLLSVLVVNAVMDPFDIYKFYYIQDVNSQKPEFATHVRLAKAHAVKRMEPQAIVLGTSRAEFGIDPEHPGWQEDAVPRYNLAIPDASAYEMRRYFEHAAQSGKLKQVVIGLDFMSFNAYKPVQPDFSEARLSVDQNGEPQNKWWSDLGATLLSGDALKASFMTYKRQGRTDYSVFLPNGQREWLHNWNIIQAKGGHRRMFHYNERRFMSEMWFPLPRNSFRLKNKQTGYTPLDELELIIAQARAKNIDVHMYISPAHARLWEALHAAGLWETFEQWKREIVAILDGDAIRHPTKAPYKVWDFSGANSITIERVPLYDDAKTQMDGYWEASHFKNHIGNLILNRLFNQNLHYLPNDFGKQLTRSNIESVLAYMKEKQAAYRESYPNDVQEIIRQAEETQSSRFCSAFLWACD